MIEVSPERLREILAEDVTAMTDAVTKVIALAPLAVTDVERLATVLAANERLLVLIADLPERIASYSPFRDEAEIFVIAKRECRALAVELESAEAAFRLALAPAEGSV